MIETVDTVREVNRWEIGRLDELVPDWAELTPIERTDRVRELIGDGAEFCRSLEGETIDRAVIGFEVDESAKLIDKATEISSCSPQNERDAEGNLTNAVRARFGRAALDVGTPDRGDNDERTDAVDAVANILHWLNHNGIDPAAVLESASGQFLAEAPAQTAESRAVEILKAAGFDAHLEHTGGGIWVAEVRSETIEGRTVWITDSEGAEGGPFLVGVYPDAEGQPWFESLSGPCAADDLPVQVGRALTQPAPKS
jgi:hypothetical protein